jgi:hypothetical protein
MSKGTAQTDEPQIAVRPQLSLGGAFLTAYAKNVSSPSVGWETGAGIGARRRLATIDWTVSVTLKKLFDMPSGIDDQAMEVAISGSRKLGSLSTQVTVYLSPDELGSSGRSFYGEASGTLPVTGGLNVVASLGLRKRADAPDYTAMSAGISQALAPGVRAELRYYDTNKNDLAEAYKGRFVAAVRAAF